MHGFFFFCSHYLNSTVSLTSALVFVSREGDLLLVGSGQLGWTAREILANVKDAVLNLWSHRFLSSFSSNSSYSHPSLIEPVSSKSLWGSDKEEKMEWEMKRRKKGCYIGVTVKG